MTPIRLLVIILIATLPGCDVALGVYFATRKKSSSGSSPPAAPAPDTQFHVYVKQVPSGTETTEEASVTAAGGDPGAAGWTDIGAASATVELALPPPASFTAIAVRANSLQVYNFESIQLLDAAGDVTETASGTTYQNTFMQSPANILGPPDGTVATSAADATHDAYVFTIYVLANSPTTVRVNAWGTAPASGDVDLRQSAARGGIQRAGGAALKSDGTLYAMARDDFAPNREVLLFKFPSSGLAPPIPTIIESGGNSASGNNTLVITPTDDVFTATTGPGTANPSSVIHLQKLEGTTPLWTQTYGPTTSLNRVEAHGLTLDSSGNLVLAGGFDFGVTLGGLGPFLRKIGPDGSPLWALPPGPPGPPFDTNGDYWHAVTASVNFFVTGSLEKTPPTGSIQIYTQMVDGSNAHNGAFLWQDYQDGPNGPVTFPAQGNAVATDSLGNAYVGGYYGTSGPAKNAIILQYPATGSPAAVTTILARSVDADSEVLDLAVDSTGAIYATGYETVTLASARQNLFLLKLASDGTVVWKRTYNGGQGDDRGVSLVLAGSHVYVYGETTVAAGDVDVFYLRYMK